MTSYRFYTNGSSLGHVFFIKKVNEIWTCGNSSDHQCGISKAPKSSAIPLQCKSDFFHRKILQIACGALHTIILTSNFLAFSCGNNDMGQLSNGQLGKKLLDRQLSIKYRVVGENEFKNGSVKKIFCGTNHNMFLCKNGIFAAGDNTFGQLGISTLDHINTKTAITKATRVNIESDKIRDICCGQRVTFFLTKLGDVMYCGGHYWVPINNRYRRTISAETNIHIPIQVSSKVLQDIKVTRIFGAWSHFIFIGKSGKVFGTGSNEYGELSFPKYYWNNIKSINFRNFNGNDIKDIQCGESMSIILLKDGNVFGMGKREHFGCEKKFNLRGIIEMRNNVHQIACTRNDLFMFTRKSNLLVCGMNQFGQLCMGKKGSLCTEIVKNKNVVLLDLEREFDLKGISTYQKKLLKCNQEGLFVNVILKR